MIATPPRPARAVRPTLEDSVSGFAKQRIRVSRPMNIVLNSFGNIEVDDRLYSGNVESAAGDIFGRKMTKVSINHTNDLNPLPQVSSPSLI